MMTIPSGARSERRSSDGEPSSGTRSLGDSNDGLPLATRSLRASEDGSAPSSSASRLRLTHRDNDAVGLSRHRLSAARSSSHQGPPCPLFTWLMFKMLSCLPLSSVTTPGTYCAQRIITLRTVLTLLLIAGHVAGLLPLEGQGLKPKACHKVVIEDFQQLQAQQDCSVIDGRLHIMDTGNGSLDGIQDFSFWNLREITGNLMLFNVSKVRTLRRLFPALSVIRGQELFREYGVALAVLSMPHLEDLGLVSLTVVERGRVWLADNPRLCHVHSVDWKALAPSVEAASHQILKNKPEELCSNNCSASCGNTSYNGVTRNRCWSAEPDGCQRNLDCPCPHGQFCAADGSCCHQECLGGCLGSSASSCFACKTTRHGGQCLKLCPRDRYLFADHHKCLNQSECMNLKEPRGSNKKCTSNHPKLLKGSNDQTNLCVFDCPNGYMEEKNKMDGSIWCRKCQGPCHRVCDEMHIHSTVHEFQKLKYCRVIEGSLHITLIEFVSQEEYDRYSFPELREITGHFMMFRVFGLRTLRNLFPNLAVIRGQTLLYNYALIIQELRDLEEIGLVSLTSIANGAVRLTKNFKLCYVNTIDWGRIARGVEPSAHQFLENREEVMCPNFCNSTCAKSKFDGHERQRCWTSAPDGCQKNLECKCAGGQPCQPNGQDCCHPYCIGGCSGPLNSDCFACKNVLYKNTCQKECSPGTYMFANRRCLLDEECLSLRSQRNGQNEVDNPDVSKLLEGTGNVPSQCLFKCPKGYTPAQNKASGPPDRCVPCQDFCPKICGESKVFSIEDSVKLRGCSKIEGFLEIQINAGEDIDNQLTENLRFIREVTGYIKIVKSHILLTLHFFKSLEIIRGTTLSLGKYSLIIMDNINLQELFPESQMKKIVIEKGLFNIHSNRKLCFDKIKHFIHSMKSMPAINDRWLDVNANNSINGNQIPCKNFTLNLNVIKIKAEIVQFAWERYSRGSIRVGNMTSDTGDSRQLLNYIIYYRESPENITDIFQGRDACSENEWVSKTVKTELNFTYIHNLKPYTRYALYVEADTLSTATFAARSPIVYFRTMPAAPSEPLDLKVSSNDPHKLDVSWKPPKDPNGIVTNYKVVYTLQKFNSSTFEQRDYCSNPIDKSLEEEEEAKAKAKKLEEERLRAAAEDQNCCACPKKQVDRDKKAEEKQEKISFQNYLQAATYKKTLSNRCIDSFMNRSDDNDDSAIANTTVDNEDSDIANVRRRRSANTTSGLGLETPATSANDSPDKQTQPAMETKEITVHKPKVTLGGLEHFSYYSIEVMACHDPDPIKGHKLCGAGKTSAITTGQTQPKHSNDVIKESSISVHAKGNNVGEIIIRWQPPQNPNGPVLKYNIKYQRILPLPEGTPEIACVSHQQYVNFSQGYIITGLKSGNYTFQIRPLTVAGNGSYSKNFYFTVASVTEPQSGDTNKVYIALACIPVLVIIVLAVFFFYNRNKRGLRADTVSSNPHYFHTDNFYAPDEWEVDRDDIRMLKELGQGSFGMVFEGLMEDKEAGTTTKVAIKTVNDKADFIERWKILKEATTMKVFECHHVVKLLGVVSKSQPALVILELMAFGDLRSYLRRCRTEEEDFPNLTPPSSNKIRQMAGEIADGMAYLADKKIVHRDLAARNCLVAEDTTVKIADFGMARDVYLTEYYRKDQRALLPIRWMAPESLLDGVFTTMSDVWSYGVVLWEMVTLAEQPYQGLGNEQVLNFVSEGHVMNEPEGCPEDLYEMMQKCWAYSPRNRPTFKYIIEMLVPYLSNRFHQVSYFFQEVVHSDTDDNGEDGITDEKQNEMGGNSDDGVVEEEEEEEEGNDDDYEQCSDDEDRARFEEEKLIKGNYGLYASSSGDEENTLKDSPGSSLSQTTTPASSWSQVRFIAPSSPKSFSSASHRDSHDHSPPHLHRASPKTLKGGSRQSSPLVHELGTADHQQQQPLLRPPRPQSTTSSSSSTTKDPHHHQHHSSNSPERRWCNDTFVHPYGAEDAKGAGDVNALDSLHIDEEELPSSEHLKLLPKKESPRVSPSQQSQSDRHGGVHGFSKVPPPPSSFYHKKQSAPTNSDADSQYTLMMSPTSASSKYRSPFSQQSGENIPISPSSPPVNPVSSNHPFVPSSSSSLPSSSSSPSTASLKSPMSPSSLPSPPPPPVTAATSNATTTTKPPFSSLAPLTVTPITQPTTPQLKSKPANSTTAAALGFSTNDDGHPHPHPHHHRPSSSNQSDHHSDRPSSQSDRNRKSGSDLKWYDVFQNNNMMGNNRDMGGANSVSPHGRLYSDSGSDVDSIPSSSHNASEGSGSKESSSSAGSHHHLTGGTTAGHGPYSCPPTALC